MIEDYFGRRVLVPIVDMPSKPSAKIEILPTIKIVKNVAVCQRCGAKMQVDRCRIAKA